MRRKTLIAVICLTAIFLYVPFNFCSAQDQEVEEIRSILQEKIVEIDRWEIKANFLISLIVIVGVLGVLAAIFQKSNKRRYKIATAITGAVISVITITSNTVFNVDYRTLRTSSVEARYLIDDIRLLLYLKENISDENDINEWRNEIKKKLGEIMQLRLKVAKSKVKFDIISTAYAQPNEEIERPHWIRQPPRDENIFYFVGYGSGSSIEEARLVSKKAGSDKVKAYLTGLLAQAQAQQTIKVPNKNIDELSVILANSAIEENTFLTRNRATKIFHYYVLFSLNKELLDIDIRLYSAKEKVKITPKFRQEIQAQVQE